MSKAVWFAVPIAAITAALVVALLVLGDKPKARHAAGADSEEPADSEERATGAPREPTTRGAPGGGAALPGAPTAGAADPPPATGEGPGVGPTGLAPGDVSPSSLPGAPDEKLRPARDAFAHERYAEARTSARQVLETDPANTRAWRMVGTSSCYLKDQATANEAFEHLGDRERRFVRFLCKRNGIEMPADDAPAK